MQSRQEIFFEIETVLKKISNNDIKIDLSTLLLGDNYLIDSLTIIELITWSNDYYKINVLDDDLNLDSMKTVGSFVNKIYDMQK